MQDSIFRFLETDDGVLARLGSGAEKNLVTDPNTSLLKTRQFGELVARLVAQAEEVDTALVESQAELTRVLHERNLVPRDVRDGLHAMRIAGNAAMHEFSGTPQQAESALRAAHLVGAWFARQYCEFDGEIEAFEVKNHDMADVGDLSIPLAPNSDQALEAEPTDQEPPVQTDRTSVANHLVRCQDDDSEETPFEEALEQAALKACEHLSDLDLDTERIRLSADH